MINPSASRNKPFTIILINYVKNLNTNESVHKLVFFKAKEPKWRHKRAAFGSAASGYRAPSYDTPPQHAHRKKAVLFLSSRSLTGHHLDVLWVTCVQVWPFLIHVHLWGQLGKDWQKWWRTENETLKRVWSSFADIWRSKEMRYTPRVRLWSVCIINVCRRTIIKQTFGPLGFLDKHLCRGRVQNRSRLCSSCSELSGSLYGGTVPSPGGRRSGGRGVQPLSPKEFLQQSEKPRFHCRNTRFSPHSHISKMFKFNWIFTDKLMDLSTFYFNSQTFKYYFFCSFKNVWCWYSDQMCGMIKTFLQKIIKLCINERSAATCSPVSPPLWLSG